MEVWERQALLDARTLDGKTALAIATIRGSLQIVSHLGACGAAADTPDAVTGSAPVHWAGAPPPPRGLECMHRPPPPRPFAGPRLLASG